MRRAGRIWFVLVGSHNFYNIILGSSVFKSRVTVWLEQTVRAAIWMLAGELGGGGFCNEIRAGGARRVN